MLSITSLIFSDFHILTVKVVGRGTQGVQGNPVAKPVDLGDLSPEERANIAIEMSSVMGEIMLDSIRDRHPGISDANLLRLARKRMLKGT